MTRNEVSLEWIIRLKLNGREISNTTTDEPGMYSFTNLEPGDYTVTVDQQAGWVQSFPGGGYYNIYLPDKNAHGYDFGSFRLSRAPAKFSRASNDFRHSKAPDESDDSVPFAFGDWIRPWPRPGPYD